MYIHHLECCGVRELSALSSYDSAKDAILSMLRKDSGKIDEKEFEERVERAMEARETWIRSHYLRYTEAQIQDELAEARPFIEEDVREEMQYELEDYLDPYEYEDSILPTNFRYAIFTQAGRRGQGGRNPTRYGTNLAAYITRNKLGKVVSTDSNVNPNSGNPLRVFIWTVNHSALAKWAKKHGRKHGED